MNRTNKQAEQSVQQINTVPFSVTNSKILVIIMGISRIYAAACGLYNQEATVKNIY